MNGGVTHIETITIPTVLINDAALADMIKGCKSRAKDHEWFPKALARLEEEQVRRDKARAI